MNVTKRNGDVVPYSADKIRTALTKALKASGEWMDGLERTVICIEEDDLDLYDGIGVEEIQDQLEEALMERSFFKTAKAFILYRKEHAEDRELQGRLDYMNRYVDAENAATGSETDPNANVSIKNVANLESEVWKEKNRKVQRQRMKRKLKEMYPEVADQYTQDIENHICYVCDESVSPAIKPYCQAVTLYPLMLEGTGNIDGVTPSAPNDLQSFSGQITNLVFLLSSQVKGACAVGSYQIALNYYVVKEFGEKWYDHLDDVVTTAACNNQHTVRDMIRKAMKQFIYGVNQPAGNRSYNSPFTNVSYYDSIYFNSLFEHFYYPDGTKPEWKAIDTLQRMFMELHRELRLIKPLTFPVSTIAMVHDGKDIIDKEYKELCAEEWAKGGSFFAYINDSPTSLSSCCFSSDTLLCWRENPEETGKMSSFGRIETRLHETGIKTIQVLHKGKWVDAKLVVIPGLFYLYKIRLEDGNVIEVTKDHIHVTQDGEKDTLHLSCSDKLAIDYNARYDDADRLHNADYLDIVSIELNMKPVERVYCIERLDQTDPYFTVMLDPRVGLITHNCRVMNEITDNTFSSTIGLTGIMTGSCNVITLNLNRIIQQWYRECVLISSITMPDEPRDGWFDGANVRRDFQRYLINILERVYKYQIAYKTMLYDSEEKGMFSNCNAGYISMSKLYCTIGLLGYVEAAEFLGYEVSNNDRYKDFLSFVFGTVKEQNRIHSIRDAKRPFVFNTEAVPGENMAVKFYQWDKSDGYKVPEDQNLYSSYFFKQWDDRISVLDKLKLHGKYINSSTDGGQACHIHLQEHLSKEQYLKIIDLCVAEGVNYFTFNIPVSECKNCGHVVNAPVTECPICGSHDIDYWTRIIGYMTKISAWSKERQIEAKKRVFTKLNEL